MSSIRTADPDRDAPACAAIYAQAVATPATFEEQAPGGDEMARRIGAARLWLVAESDDELVAYAYAVGHRAERAAYRHTVETSVYVDAAHRARGHGRALLDRLLAELREGGVHVALAGITLPNPASEHLHTSLGFRPAGVFREVGFKQGEWRDVAWLQLLL